MRITLEALGPLSLSTRRTPQRFRVLIEAFASAELRFYHEILALFMMYSAYTDMLNEPMIAETKRWTIDLHTLSHVKTF